MVARSENYISDVNDGELREIIGCGLISMGASLEAVTELEMVVICVLTPLDANLAPDLQYIESVTHELGRNLRPGQPVWNPPLTWHHRGGDEAHSRRERPQSWCRLLPGAFSRARGPRQ